MTRTAAIAATLALLLSACSGSDDDGAAGESPAAADETTAPSPGTTDEAADPGAPDAGSDDGPVWVAVDGQTQDVALDICSTESVYDTPDPRQMTAVGPSGFPFFEFIHLPPDSISAEFTDAEGVESYRTNDAAAFDVTVTPGGAEGTVTLSSLTGQADDVTVEFRFTCPADAGGESTTEPEPAEETAKTGFVDWAGSRTDFETEDFDPLAGTGLCETVDVTGLEGEDYFRIVATLDDGTDFSLTSSEGLELGDTFDPIETTIVDLTKSGRMVSGSADTPDGPISFSFSC